LPGDGGRKEWGITVSVGEDERILKRDGDDVVQHYEHTSYHSTIHLK
jgi:hypothetical protein